MNRHPGAPEPGLPFQASSCDVKCDPEKEFAAGGCGTLYKNGAPSPTYLVGDELDDGDRGRDQQGYAVKHFDLRNGGVPSAELQPVRATEAIGVRDAT